MWVYHEHVKWRGSPWEWTTHCQGQEPQFRLVGRRPETSEGYWLVPGTMDPNES